MQSALVTSAPGQNFQASQAVHDIDDITTRNFWSQFNALINCTPLVLTFILK